MSTINLAAEKTPRGYGSFLRSSIVSAVITLIIILGVYFGLVYLNKKIAGQIDDVTSQYAVEYNKFLKGMLMKSWISRIGLI